MKYATTRQTLALTFALLLTAVIAFAQGTSFTHQGRLTDNGAAANGAYDLQFALFDALSAGAQQGATITRDDVPVTNGVFTVQLDFGATPFNGTARWLQISLRTGASTGAFTLLTPRQPLSATPYAIRSASAAAADNATQLDGAINVGDALTSSATEPGKAMKATGAGKIIGIALESSAKAKDGKLLMWLQVGYHAPATPATATAQRGRTSAREPGGMAQLKAENAALKAQQDGQQPQLEELKAQLAALAAQLTQPKAADHQ